MLQPLVLISLLQSFAEKKHFPLLWSPLSTHQILIFKNARKRACISAKVMFIRTNSQTFTEALYRPHCKGLSWQLLCSKDNRQKVL